MYPATHPLVLLFVQEWIIISLLAFTSSTCILRPALLPIVLFWNYKIIPFYTVHYQRSTWIAILSSTVLIQPLDYVEKLLLSQWSFDYTGPKMQVDGSEKKINKVVPRVTVNASVPSKRSFYSFSFDTTTSWDRLRFGVWAAISHRYIGSPFQARNTPPHSSSDPTFVPSRLKFLFSRGCMLLASYLFIDLMFYSASSNQPNPAYFDQKHVAFFTRMQDVDRTELIFRVNMTIGYWIGGYLINQWVFGFVPFIAVLFGFADPASVRPVFGSLLDADTVRGFWGSFWHQELRKKFTKPTRYFVFRILRLPRRTVPQPQYLRLFTRYLEILMIFAISGLFHQISEVATGRAWAESGALEFFSIIVVGIMIEDSFQWIVEQGLLYVKKWEKEQELLSISGVLESNRIRRLVGYIWVLMFMAWATPIWAYPGLRKQSGTENDEIFPFSLARWISSLRV